MHKDHETTSQSRRSKNPPPSSSSPIQEQSWTYREVTGGFQIRVDGYLTFFAYKEEDAKKLCNLFNLELSKAKLFDY